MNLHRLFIGWSVTIAFSLQADTVVLQNGLNGYTGCSDTYLIMTSDRAQGAKENLVVEGYHCTACIDQRALIRFDLSALPPASEVTRAVLSVYSIDQPRSGPAQVNVFRVSRSWSEGVAAWMTAETGIKWARQGGDFRTPRDTFYQYGTEVAVWHSIDVTAMVKDLVVRPDKNYGIMLYMEPAMLTVRYASSNHLDPNLRPKLAIEGTTLSAVGQWSAGGRPNSSLSLRLDGHRIIASTPGRITLTDLRGREAAAGIGSKLDVSGVSAGFYVARLRTGSEIAVRRVGIAR